MKTSFRKKRNKAILFILIPLFIILIIVTYYQLLYRSPRVDNGIAKLETTFKGHGHIVTAVRFTPGDSLMITGSVDSTIKIWKRETGEVIREIKQPSGISYLDV